MPLSIQHPIKKIFTWIRPVIVLVAIVDALRIQVIAHFYLLAELGPGFQYARLGIVFVVRVYFPAVGTNVLVRFPGIVNFPVIRPSSEALRLLIILGFIAFLFALPAIRAGIMDSRNLYRHPLQDFLIAQGHYVCKVTAKTGYSIFTAIQSVSQHRILEERVFCLGTETNAAENESYRFNKIHFISNKDR